MPLKFDLEGALAEPASGLKFDIESALSPSVGRTPPQDQPLESDLAGIVQPRQELRQKPIGERIAGIQPRQVEARASRGYTPMNPDTFEPVPTIQMDTGPAFMRAIASGGEQTVGGLAEMFAVNPQMEDYGRRLSASGKAKGQQANLGNENRSFLEKGLVGAGQSAIPMAGAIAGAPLGPAGYILGGGLPMLGQIYSGAGGSESERKLSTTVQTAIEQGFDIPEAVIFAASKWSPWLRIPVGLAVNWITELGEEGAQKAASIYIEENRVPTYEEIKSEVVEAIPAVTVMTGALSGPGALMGRGPIPGRVNMFNDVLREIVSGTDFKPTGLDIVQDLYDRGRTRFANVPVQAQPELNVPGSANTLAQQPTQAAPLDTAAANPVDRMAELDAESVALAARKRELNDPANGYGPMFDTERAEIFTRQMEIAQERAELELGRTAPQPDRPVDVAPPAAPLDTAAASMDEVRRQNEQRIQRMIDLAAQRGDFAPVKTLPTGTPIVGNRAVSSIPSGRIAQVLDATTNPNERIALEQEMARRGMEVPVSVEPADPSGGLARGIGSAGSMAIPAGVDSVAGDEGVQGLTADTAMWLGAGDVAGYLQGKTASEKDALLAEIRSRDASHADEIQSLLPSQTPDTAPTPKTDGSSEIVGANGMRIVHGSGNANLTADDIQIVRQGQKQGKKGRSYGGLYGASETDLAQAEEYAAMMGGSPTVYDITIQPGTRVLHKEGDITRLSENYINDLVAQGYGLVTGRDMRGRNEYVVIDRNAVATMQPRSTPINQAVPASLPVESAARTLNEDGRATDGKPINPGDVFRTLSGRNATPYPKVAIGDTEVQAPAEEGRPQEVAPPADESSYLVRTEVDKAFGDQYANADSRTTPSAVKNPPVGSWILDERRGIHGREIEQVIEIPVENIEVSEDTGPQKWPDVERYAGWILDGKEMPAIRVLQTDAGTLKTVDHRRLMAAKAAGKKTIIARVSWSGMDGDVATGYTFEMAQRGITPMPIKPARPDRLLFPDDVKALERIKQKFGASASKPAQQPPVRPARAARPSNNLIRRIHQLGGINLRYLPDVAGERKVQRGMPVGLFRKNGMGLDDLSRMLADEGFPINVEDPTDIDGVRQLTELLQKTLSGSTVLNYSGQQAMLDAMAKAEAEIDVSEQATLDDPEAIAEREAIKQADIAIQGVTNDELDSLLDAAFNDERTPNAILSDEEIDQLFASASDASQTQPEGPDADSVAGSPEAESFALDAYTPEDLKQREVQPEPERPEAPSPADFVLSGSNRQADEAEARGQTPMFSKAHVETEAFKRWSNNAPLVTSEQADTYTFKTGERVVVEAFHGTKRPDRVGTKFLKRRATSGPMAFFTSDPTLASGYAQSKSDTSLAMEDQHYATWFKWKPPGSRSKVDIVRAWHFLDGETKQKIREIAPTLRMDDDGNVVSEEGNKTGNGSYDYNLEESARKSYTRQGNPLEALVEDWLNSGILFNDEETFLDVLSKIGFTKDVEYDSPFAEYPFVYKAYVEMQSPLVTTDVPQNVKDALNAAAKRDRTRPKPIGSDTWDKTLHTLREWVEIFNSEDNIYVWTSIPDKVTDVLRGLGYDGIIDKSGKGGGAVHPVYIPFEESQVKSAIGNKGKYDADKNDILKGVGTPTGKGMTVEAVIAYLRKRFGKRIDKMLESGTLKIVATPAQLPAWGKGQRGIGGAWDGTTAWIVASQASPETLAATYLHEVGEHAGMQEMLGDKYPDIIARLDDLIWEGDATANRAASRVPKDTPVKDEQHERLAYFIEEAQRARDSQPQTLSTKARQLLQDILAAIRAWAYRKFGGITLTEADILALAKQSAKRVADRAGQAQGQTTAEAMLQKVWHGTPHIWAPEPGFPHGRPRLDKMGTGEGAQAYGWGWYSAESQGVAVDYRKRLSSFTNIVDGKVTRNSMDAIVGDQLQQFGGDAGKTKKYFSDKSMQYEKMGLSYKPALLDAARYKDFAAYVDVMAGKKYEKNEGVIYQLDIPDAALPYLLDWDKPLSEQTQEVRDAINTVAAWKLSDDSMAMSYNGKTGRDFYEALVALQGSKKSASNVLARLGIVGNRYLDGQSRDKGEGSYNYVIWDQPTLDKIALLERNGEKLDAMREAEVQMSRDEELSSEYEIPNSSGNAIATPIDGAKLRELRLAASDIEAPDKGITFQVTEDGRAIVTGPARTRVPARFQRFSEQHGLTIVVRRGPVDSISPGRMPDAFRASGALYFGEISPGIDRTGRVRFSKEPQSTDAEEMAKKFGFAIKGMADARIQPSAERAYIENQEMFERMKRGVVSNADSKAAGEALAAEVGWSPDSVDAFMKEAAQKGTPPVDILAAMFAMSRMQSIKLLEAQNPAQFIEYTMDVLRTLMATRAYGSEMGRALQFIGAMERMGGYTAADVAGEGGGQPRGQIDAPGASTIAIDKNVSRQAADLAKEVVETGEFNETLRKTADAKMSEAEMEAEVKQLEADLAKADKALSDARKAREAARQKRTEVRQSLKHANDLTKSAQESTAKHQANTVPAADIQAAEDAMRAAQAERENAWAALVKARQTLMKAKKMREKAQGQTQTMTGKTQTAKQKTISNIADALTEENLRNALGGDKGIQKIMAAMHKQGKNVDLGMLVSYLSGMVDSIAKEQSENRTTLNKLMAMHVELWRANILTGLFTHEVNVTSNAANMLIEFGLVNPIQEMLPGGIGLGGYLDALKAMGGYRKVLADIWALMKHNAFEEAPASRLSHLLDQRDPELLALMRGTEGSKWADSHRKFIPGLAGKVVRGAGFVPLGIEDAIFKVIPFRYELARQQASGEQRNVTAAIDAAKKLTFQDSTGMLGMVVAKMHEKAPYSEFWITFVKTMTNLIKRSFDLTPGLSQAKNWGALIGKEGDKARREAIALSIVGVGIASMVMALMGDDDDEVQLSGFAPFDRLKKLLWMEEHDNIGLRIGDEVYPFYRMSPLAEPAGLTIGAYNSIKQGEAGPLFNAMYQSIVTKHFMAKIADLIDGIEEVARAEGNEKSEAGERLVRRQLGGIATGTLIPNFIAQLGDMTDAEKREVNTIMQDLQKKIPGLRESLPSKLKVTGEVLGEPRYMSPFPVQGKPVKKDEVTRWLLKLGRGIDPNPKSIKDLPHDVRQTLLRERWEFLGYAYLATKYLDEKAQEKEITDMLKNWTENANKARVMHGLETQAE